MFEFIDQKLLEKINLNRKENGKGIGKIDETERKRILKHNEQ